MENVSGYLRRFLLSSRTITLINHEPPANTPVALSVSRPLPFEKDLPSGDLRPKVALVTLGCKVNFSETEALADNFQRAGFALVDAHGTDIPDVFVVNTCTVTHVADRKSRQMLRRVKRANPQAVVVATGCYVYTSPGEVSGLPEVDLVVKKTDEEKLVELVSERLNYELPYRPEPSRLLFAGGLSPSATAKSPALDRYRTRAMVKIQDGCNAGCAFCIVPTARGGPQSVGIQEIVEGVRLKALAGFQEVVLTGVHLGKYRAPAENGQAEGRPVRLKSLLEAVLREVDIPRLRITSLEPQDYDPTLLELWQQDRRLSRHFHLALQAGSDATLVRMRRGYNLERYARIVEQIRRELPDASITTDVIVGFPGETDQEAAETLAFARQMGYAKMHIFPYSPRAGTLAATMSDQVPEPVKKERAERLRLLSDELSQSWRQRFIGEERPVLWENNENSSDTTVWSGLTDNYIRVYASSTNLMHNHVTRARLLRLAGQGDAEGMWGEIIA
ncbi:MAG: tRNA ((6)-L-threonylcarbamoyladenosine(37)-C(2))-methylthiotransferase MtaB [Chloroflexi bacterium]|jgi:threonylcarbamoyladenosine tRNA methylthiotransferase MtaB|nr:tRNA ((6)-L-threonylcarbamoyladenosine(37)-C(2))-methylthiotransferase MtaB [Chloroflexota bacterium]